ncbi:hypothetical protein FACS1894190_12450 [Spirochaetia bacterium]|nr:hypothetical protein FACS1894190_12450 [Spirochaetia bacterium]
MKKDVVEAEMKSMIYVATPFSARTHDLVDTAIFTKPARLDLSHGSNLLAPPCCIQEAIAKASVWGTTMSQYGSPNGPYSLRELIAEYESSIFQDMVSTDNVIITLGGTDGLAVYFQYRASEITQKFKPTVLLIGPQYPTLARIAEANGFTVAMTQFAYFDCQLSKIAILELKPNTVVITQPSNPFGTFLSADEFALLCITCAKIKADIVVDRVCGDFASAYYQQSPKYRIIARKNGVRLTEVESYSKRRGIPGLRIGYNIMPTEIVSWCTNAVIGRTITSIGCVAVEADIRAFLNNDEEYKAQVINNHAIVNRNVRVFKELLGSRLISSSTPANGANFLAVVRLPKPMLESVAALWLYNTYNLGTYPISCFELWTESEATDIMRIRITAATPQEGFDKAVYILLSALSESNLQKEKRK